MKGIFAAIGTIAVVVMFGALLSIETIDEGERGVVLRNGAYSSIAEPGMNFITPLVDSVKSISIRTNSRLYQDEPFYSADRQAATMTVSVTYKLAADKIAQIYSEYGGEEGVLTRLVDRRVKKELKEVMGTFTAATAITERERLGVEVAKAMTENIAGPILIESVQIEDVNFSDAYEKSIEKRMLAENEVERLKQEKKQEAERNEITVAKAQADADAIRKKAQADADAIRLKGDADASAIAARGKALRDNPTVIDLVKVETWNGQLPATMVPGGALPFVNLSPN
ncbi:prohibitin family protein [Pseudaminobacter sp. 19-2017]|uniref:Prohibitin family protein n=1 Tax=Pseudaminobacter soli (ex Zhang et al. 2022) TaxID=2831468 RepID=A0A942I8Z8_9HYPH|nr:prohibitin family protein [Pseudaminobacter soli]MBS3648771.1 prohibitin family protein [Pseudaminobacter soli]